MRKVLFVPTIVARVENSSAPVTTLIDKPAKVPRRVVAAISDAGTSVNASPVNRRVATMTLPVSSANPSTCVALVRAAASASRH
jgi:hypothetical protein